MNPNEVPAPVDDTIFITSQGHYLAQHVHHFFMLRENHADHEFTNAQQYQFERLRTLFTQWKTTKLERAYSRLAQIPHDQVVKNRMQQEERLLAYAKERHVELPELPDEWNFLDIYRDLKSFGLEYALTFCFLDPELRPKVQSLVDGIVEGFTII